MGYEIRPSPMIPWVSHVVRPTGITPESLKELSNRLDVHMVFEGALGKVGNDYDSGTNYDVRRCAMTWLRQDNQAEWGWLWQAVSRMTEAINGEVFHYDLRAFYDDIMYAVYDDTMEGHFDWHIDQGTFMRPPRKLSLSILLNDPAEFDGGILQLNNGQPVDVAMKQGDICFFPSFMLHRVTPVTRGTRRTLVGWASGPAFR